MSKSQGDIHSRKKLVLEHAVRVVNLRKTCRYCGVSRAAVSLWKRAYEAHGDAGLVNRRPCPTNPKLGTPPAIVKKVLPHFGQFA